MLRIAIVVAHTLLALLVIASPARPCGALFSSSTSENLAIDAQRALLIVREDVMALHLQLATSTDGAPFSWIVPVPATTGAPTITLGDDAVFAALDALTTPSVTIEASSGGGPCGSVDKAGGGDRNLGGVTHFGGAELGPYTYDIVAATASADLSTWLSANNYLVPAGFDAAITPYIAGNVFIAVRLTAGPALQGAITDPLVITWPRPFGAGLGYAFGLSKLSSADVMPLVLWVLADKRQRVANYGSIDVRAVAAEMLEGGGDYEDAVERLTLEAGGRLVTTEFAKDLRPLSGTPTLIPLESLIDDEAFYLTRFYASVPRAAIEDLVITFANEAPDVEPDITVSAHAAPFAFVSFAFLWFNASSRRRKVGPSSRKA